MADDTRVGAPPPADSRLSGITSAPAGVPAAPFVTTATERVVAPSSGGPAPASVWVPPSAPAPTTSPFATGVGGEEALSVRVWCGTFGTPPATPPAVDVVFRFVGANGERQLTVTSITPTTNRVANTRTIPLGFGALQDLTVQWTGAPTLSGLCYVTVLLQRGLAPGATRIVAQLAGGYVRPGQGLAWPGAAVQTSLDGPGYSHTVDAGAIAAGTDAAFAIPSGAVWSVQSVFGVLTNDATALGRRPDLTLADASGLRVLRVPAQALSPSQVCSYTWAVNATNVDVNQDVSVRGLPAGFLLHGGTAAIVTTNLQPADQWTTVHVFANEWLEGNP